MKSCEGIPITTFGVILVMCAILLDLFDKEDNGVNATNDAIDLKNDLLFILNTH
ncbi:hypothetical protein VEE10_28590 [Escherichia coli]|nr:hypothetical protein VEE10_28590 [Escherichia coli]